MLRDLTPGVFTAPESDVLRALVRQLASALGVAYAFVAERGADGATARVLALWSDGRFVDGVTYPLAGTPCLNVLLGEVCAYPSGVQAAFPGDPMLVDLGVDSYVGAPLASAAGHQLGWLAVMDHGPVADAWFAQSVVALFTVRAAAELDRRHGEAALRAAHEDLERHVADRTHALQLSEEKFARAFRASPNALTISRAVDGRFLEVNDTYLRWHGAQRHEVIGRTSLELGLWADPRDRARMLAQLTELGSVRQFPFSFRRGDGRLRDGLLWAERLAIGSEACLLVEVSDVTELRALEAARQETEIRLQAILDSATNVVWVKDPEGRHLLVNHRFETVFGLRRDYVVGRRDDDLFSPDLALAFRVTDLKVLSTGSQLDFEATAALGGRVRAFLVQKFPLRESDGRIYAVCGIATDITERKLAEDRLLHDALHDALTGLPNRALLMDRLGRAVERARRHPANRFAVLFLDLDRFKLVNDGLGHAVGDELLVAVARVLQTCLRPGDTVARLGGDEFAMLLEEVRDASDATRVAERVQRALGSPVRLAPQQVFPSVSIGIALSGAPDAGATELLRDADTAMYRAKAAGGARAEVFDPRMHEQAVALLGLETDLRHALERSEFVVHYQPIFAADGARITGCEALIRWAHPTRGMLEPPAFLGVAQDTGLIVPIGLWVLTEACRQLRRWQDQFPADPPLVMSVNLCSRQFRHPGLLDRVRTILEETGAPAHSLMIELTEDALMEHEDDVMTTLGGLRRLGVRLALDDFGTGYSSLAYLHRFPIDVLKIDRAFVRGVSCGGEKLEIVRTIVTLARALSKDVIAEGVETVDQLECLRALGCDGVQGYLLAPPQDAEATARVLARRRHPHWHARLAAS